MRKKPSSAGSRRPPGDGVDRAAQNQEGIPVASLPPGLGTAPATGVGPGQSAAAEDALSRGLRRPEVDGYRLQGIPPRCGSDPGPASAYQGRALRAEGIPVASLPPGLGTAPATSEGTRSTEETNETPDERKKRRAREVSARWRAERKAELAARPKPRGNPLFNLAEEQSSKLFVWLRECPYHDAVKQMLADQGIEGVTDAELNEFFEAEARMHWERRLQRAATEANALVNYVEQNPVKFSAGILAALGQEAFRQIASGEVAPEAMARMTNLFLKARADERSDQLLDLRREKMELDRRTATEAALETFAAEIEKHPAARAAFEALRAELLRKEGE